jgi:hypothetical protein
MNTESELSLRDTPQGAVFEVRVHPRAKRTAITGILDGRLKLALASPPVDGRANEELQQFFAKLFNVSRSAVVLLAGEHARNKRVMISQQGGAAIRPAIRQALAASNPSPS